jgi:hypothetical protein
MRLSGSALFIGGSLNLLLGMAHFSLPVMHGIDWMGNLFIGAAIGIFICLAVCNKRDQ